MCLCLCICLTVTRFWSWSWSGFNLCAVHWRVLVFILLNRFLGLCILFRGSLLTGVCVLSFWVFFGFITTYSRVYLCPVSLLKYSYFLRLFCTF